MAEITIVHPRVLQETDLKAMAALRTSAREVVYKGYSDYSVDQMCVQVNPNSDNVVDSK